MDVPERKSTSKRRLLSYGWWIIIVIISLIIISTLRNVYYAGKEESPESNEYITPVKQTPSDLPNQAGNTTNPDVNEQIRLSDRFQCYSLGSCQKCSEAEMITEDTCKDTGYREPIQCSYKDSNKPSPKEPVEVLPTFRNCSRTKYQGKLQFFKFLGFVIFISVCSGTLLVLRRRKIQREQYRRLMRRIENA
ncbi:hypothetical protein K7432_017290 [Basidiobolus ranarum]|uniref:Uncharacterized protein n=1 Tax=Basidiobolus ranarum TaxID=34480 RepID=A0ABR2VLQ2_9FUNG